MLTDPQKASRDLLQKVPLPTPRTLLSPPSHLPVPQTEPVPSRRQSPASDVDTNPWRFTLSGSGRFQGPGNTSSQRLGVSPEPGRAALAALAADRSRPKAARRNSFIPNWGLGGWTGAGISLTGPRAGEGLLGICQKWGGASGDWSNGSWDAGEQLGEETRLLPKEQKLG